MGVASTADTNNGAPVASAAKATSSLSPLLKGLVGASSFVRHNPKSDRFKVRLGRGRRREKDECP